MPSSCRQGTHSPIWGVLAVLFILSCTLAGEGAVRTPTRKHTASAEASTVSSQAKVRYGELQGEAPGEAYHVTAAPEKATTPHAAARVSPQMNLGEVLPELTLEYPNWYPNETQAVTIHFPMVRCASGDIPLYDGFVIWNSRSPYPPGVSAIRLHESGPYKMILRNLEVLEKYRVTVGMWCGTEKVDEIHRVISTVEGDPRDFVDIRVECDGDAFSPEFSSGRHVKGLTYDVKFCRGSGSCRPAKPAPPSSAQGAKSYDFTTHGKLGKYTMKFLAKLQGHGENRYSASWSYMEMDNSLDSMPSGIGGHLEDTLANRFAKVQHLNIEFEYLRPYFVVYVRLGGYECIEYGGPKTLDLVFAWYNTVKMYVRANFLINSSKLVYLLMRSMGETTTIHAVGTLECVEGNHVIDVGVEVGPLRKDNVTDWLAPLEEQSRYPDRMTLEAAGTRDDAAVRVRYPPVVTCGQNSVRYRGIGIPKRNGPGAHTYEDPRIEIDSTGRADTFRDLDFWTTYIVTSTVFCSFHNMPVTTFVDEFYTGPGRLQDIERLGVEIINGDVFASIYTMRYNFTGAVTFKLTLCEDYPDDNLMCQDHVEPRSQARTLVKLRTRPIMNYTLTVTPTGQWEGDTFQGRTITVSFTTEPCNDECLQSFKGGRILSPTSFLGQEQGTSYVQVLQPNPCSPGRKENVTLEYATTAGDRRGFMIVNARQYNLIGLTLDGFKEGSFVSLKTTVNCWNLPYIFHFAGQITTASVKIPEQPQDTGRPFDPVITIYDYVEIEPRRPSGLEDVRFLLVEELEDGSHDVRFLFPEVDFGRVQYNVTVCDRHEKCNIHIIDRYGPVAYVHLTETTEQVFELSVKPFGQYSTKQGHLRADPMLTITTDDRPSKKLAETIQNDPRTVALDVRVEAATLDSANVIIEFHENACAQFDDGSTVRYVSLYLSADNGRKSHFVADIRDPAVTSVLLPGFQMGSAVRILGRLVCQHAEEKLDLLYRAVYAFGMISPFDY